MTTPRFATPVRVLEATTGLQLPHAAGLWLRASRVDEPWRDDDSGPILLAFIDGVPVAAARAQPTQFGTVGLRRFRAAPGVDAQRLREHLANFLNRDGVRDGTRSVAALAA